MVVLILKCEPRRSEVCHQKIISNLIPSSFVLEKIFELCKLSFQFFFLSWNKIIFHKNNDILRLLCWKLKCRHDFWVLCQQIWTLGINVEWQKGYLCREIGHLCRHHTLLGHLCQHKGTKMLTIMTKVSTLILLTLILST